MQHDQEHKPGHGDTEPGYPDGKGFSIIINARERAVEDEELTFDQIVDLAFPDGPKGEFICYTIRYQRAGGRKPEGKLVAGGVVKVRDGTVFNVAYTDKS